MQASPRAQLGIKWPKPRVQNEKWGELATMANARGQLWASYGPAMGQLWDNYGTTMGQLWDNLWDNPFSAGFRAFRDLGKENQNFSFLETKCDGPKKIQGFRVVP